MHDISAFFARKAALLNEGRIAEACTAVLLPTTIYLGDEIMFVSEMSKLVGFMETYVQKLRDLGMTEITHEILKQAPLRNGGVQAQVRWHSLGETGAAHQTVEITYYCRPHGDDWKIALVEVNTPRSDVFAATKGS